MPVRTAEARWQKSLQDGSGTMRVGSGAFEGRYSFASRMENGIGTNPEELIGAAEAGCFSMAFANALSEAGHKPQEIRTSANVHFAKIDKGWTITQIELSTEGSVTGIDEASFKTIAADTMKTCLVSRALDSSQ